MAMARTSKATQQHNIAILNSALFCSAFTNQVMYIISYEHRESVSCVYVSFNTKCSQFLLQVHIINYFKPILQQFNESTCRNVKGYILLLLLAMQWLHWHFCYASHHVQLQPAMIEYKQLLYKLYAFRSCFWSISCEVAELFPKCSTVFVIATQHVFVFEGTYHIAFYSTTYLSFFYTATSPALIGYSSPIAPSTTANPPSTTASLPSTPKIFSTPGTFPPTQPGGIRGN